MTWNTSKFKTLANAKYPYTTVNSHNASKIDDMNNLNQNKTLAMVDPRSDKNPSGMQICDNFYLFDNSK